MTGSNPTTTFVVFVVTSSASRIARAQTYPTRPVRIIVGFAAGGRADITARLIGQWLSERLGKAFIIENRPGVFTSARLDSGWRRCCGRSSKSMISGSTRSPQRG
jgi:hypothetical protein